MKQKIIFTLFAFFFISLGTFIAIRWAKGYRFNLKDQNIEGTGLLVANSQPQGASVYVDGQLKTATDDTLHLTPKDYQIRLEKDGYYSWQKIIKIENELVSQTNARLWPAVPNLSAITVNSASNPFPSPNGQKIAYRVASESAEKNGLWIVNLSGNFLGMSSSSLQIIRDSNNLKFSEAQIFWNPNSNEILAYFNGSSAYLLNASKENKIEDLINVSFQLDNLVNDWLKQVQLDQQKKMAKLPEPMYQITTTSATMIYFSPNEEKILYVATNSATIPPNLIPPLPASSTQKEDREITAGNIYVYDLKEDKNFLIIDKALEKTDLAKDMNNYSLPYLNEENLKAQISPSPIENIDNLKQTPILPNKNILQQLIVLQAQYSPVYTHNLIQWFPNSQHLIMTEKDAISLIEYEATNKTNIYSGNFKDNFAYPWPNGDKIIILTSLSTNPEIKANLYGIGLQ
ncbi:PEGA domain-containing protein [Candidatus Beckwithbacteria bacterium]|nr:PEGA domain-containing protein [Candidatus Beckwithbacteria bacterium]